MIAGKAALIETPGVEAARGFSLCALTLHVTDFRRDGRDDRLRIPGKLDSDSGAN
jgi:hypothetical protein